MTTHDYNIANQGAAAFRTDLNNLAGAAQSNNSSTSAPSNTVAYMAWADSANNLQKFRNSGDSAWLAKLNLDSDMVTAKTTNYTTTAADFQKLIGVDASGGAVTITVLGSTTAGEGYEFAVKKTDSSTNTVTIDGNASETIDGATTLVLSNQYEAAWLRCDGSNLHVLNRTPGVATQAQQETATNVTAFVTPGRQQYNPLHPKVRVSFNGSGVVAINEDVGVSSITDNGTGDYSVNYDSPFSNALYAPFACASSPISTGNAAAAGLVSLITVSTNLCRIGVIQPGGSAANMYDSAYISFTALGDL